MGEVTVYAHLVQTGGGGVDAPEKQHRHLQVQAVSYETGRDQIRANLPDGWIVASWRVE